MVPCICPAMIGQHDSLCHKSCSWGGCKLEHSWLYCATRRHIQHGVVTNFM